MVSRDKLCDWLFPHQPDRILPLLRELSIERWWVVVLCPSRQLHFGDPAPVAEFVEQRVRWIELLNAAINPTAPALVQALARVAGSSQAAEFDVVIDAIPV